MNQSQLSVQPVSKEVTVDFDIHGIVGIRLLDPPAGAVKTLTNQIGHFRSTLDREPDITVRFAAEIAPPNLKYLGLNQAGFTDEDFFIVDKRTGGISAQIPMDIIGYPCEIVCRRKRSTIPFLFEIIRLTLLRKEYIPLHASAFQYNGIGVLVMGWTKGGKTEALLSFANHDAYYVGDEWVIVSSDGDEMFGLPVPVSIWDWQFQYIPKLLPKIRWQQQLLFKGIYFIEAIHKAIARVGLSRKFPFELLDEAMPFIKRRLRLKVLPQQIFGERYHKTRVNLDKLLLIMSHQDSGVVIDPCDGVTVAQSMVHSNVYEQEDLFGTYEAFKFAFPERQNTLIEEFKTRQQMLLQQAFANKEAYQVRHPYPVSLHLLFEQLQPYCQNKDNETLSAEVEAEILGA